MVRGLHHEDVASTSNLKMTPKPIFHSFAQLEAYKTWPYATPQFQGKDKKSSTKIKSTINMWGTCDIEMRDRNL
jgi:hypothetical protein